MNLIDLCGQANDFLALPSTIIFFGVALFLTLKTKFLQLRAVPKFLSLIKNDKYEGDDIKNMKTISPIHALFTAMATTIGMGNIVGPTIAIITGGPGALFWLVAYTFLGSVTKFTEVTFALITRKKTAEGDILGGPTQYLGLINPLIGKWYGFITIFMFAGWSGLQSNTLGKILEKEGIATWITGLVLAVILLIVLFGGVKRIGSIASKLVPVMFVLYVTFALFIIFKDFSALINALKLVCSNIFSPASAMGGFMGASVFQAMRWGSYKGIFITEAGIGTSSIAHSFADTKKPTDQGILAMYGMAAETFLCIMSGLLVLVTGVWLSVPHGQLTSTLIYDVFKLHAPVFGNWVLIISVTLFVLTTVIGNSFNGGQSFAYFTKYRFINAYYIFAALITFLGSITYVKLIWDIMEIFLALVAIPNLIGIVILACRYPEQLKIK